MIRKLMPLAFVAVTVAGCGSIPGIAERAAPAPVVPRPRPQARRSAACVVDHRTKRRVCGAAAVHVCRLGEGEAAYALRNDLSSLTLTEREVARAIIERDALECERVGVPWDEH
jgi:hypothetical protein